MKTRTILATALCLIILFQPAAYGFEAGDTCPENSNEIDVVGPVHCRLTPNDPEGLIERCNLDSDCVRFSREGSRYMQADTCAALTAAVNEVCDISDGTAVVHVAYALDPYSRSPDSPAVEGRGVLLYLDVRGIESEQLFNIVCTHFDYAMYHGQDYVEDHIYASVTGRTYAEFLPDECYTLSATYNEAYYAPAPDTTQDIAASLALFRSVGTNLEHSLVGKTLLGDNMFGKFFLGGFMKEFRLVTGRYITAWLGIKLPILDQMQIMCNDIDVLILLKPDLTEPVIINMVELFIHFIEPFYLLAIVLTAFYLLFVSGSPLGRARAKSTLLRLILSIGVIILTVPIFQLFLDLTQLISALALNLVDINIAKKFMCDECMNALTFEFVVITTIAFWSGLFIALFQTVFYFGAFLVLVLRYYMIILLAVMFPFTVFFNSFHLTRRLGAEMMYQSGWWIAMQFLEALVIIGITLAVMHIPAELMSDESFRIGMGLASFLLVAIAPLFAMGLMDWIAMMIIAFSALEVPFISATADMAEEAELEDYKKEKVTPPRPVGPPRGPLW